MEQGHKPTITIPSDHIRDIIRSGIQPGTSHSNYDNQSVIAATLGRAPFADEDRFVCELKANPDDLLPRNTGNIKNDFVFRGVIILNRHIPIEDILVTKIPKAYQDDNIKAPIKLSELAQYFD